MHRRRAPLCRPATGQSGLYSDKTNVTFDDLKAHDGTASNPLTPRIAGMADALIS